MHLDIQGYLFICTYIYVCIYTQIDMCVDIPVHGRTYEWTQKWAGCNYIRVLKTNSAGFGNLVQMKVGMFGKNLDYTV